MKDLTHFEPLVIMNTDCLSCPYCAAANSHAAGICVSCKRPILSDAVPQQVLVADVNVPYVPNHIELDKRAVYLAASALIIIYAIASLLRDDFYIWFPGGRRGRSLTEHLHGAAGWLAALASFSAAANLLSVVVDHYDSRNNETNYRAFAKWSLRVAVALLFVALLVHGATKQ